MCGRWGNRRKGKKKEKGKGSWRGGDPVPWKQDRRTVLERRCCLWRFVFVADMATASSVKLGHHGWGMSVQMAWGAWPCSQCPALLRNHLAMLHEKLKDPNKRFIAREKRWPGFPASCLAGSCLSCWVGQLSKLTLPSPEGHGGTLAVIVASTYLPQYVGIMCHWAALPRLPPCDAMAGPGEQSLPDNSWGFLPVNGRDAPLLPQRTEEVLYWVCSKIWGKKPPQN